MEYISYVAAQTLHEVKSEKWRARLQEQIVGTMEEVELSRLKLRY